MVKGKQAPGIRVGLTGSLSQARAAEGRTARAGAYAVPLESALNHAKQA